MPGSTEREEDKMGDEELAEEPEDEGEGDEIDHRGGAGGE